MLDHKKVFDQVDNSKLIELLDLINKDDKGMTILENLYYGQSAALPVGN